MYTPIIARLDRNWLEATYCNVCCSFETLRLSYSVVFVARDLYKVYFAVFAQCRVHDPQGTILL